MPSTGYAGLRTALSVSRALLNCCRSVNSSNGMRRCWAGCSSLIATGMPSGMAGAEPPGTADTFSQRHRNTWRQARAGGSLVTQAAARGQLTLRCLLQGARYATPTQHWRRTRACPPECRSVHRPMLCTTSATSTTARSCRQACGWSVWQGAVQCFVRANNDEG